MSATTTLRERAALVAELGEIVRAMKNLAFAELQRITRVLAAQAQAREAVARALSELGIDLSVPAPDTRPIAWLVVGTERGLCGAFNARLAEELASLRRSSQRGEFLVAGRRLAELVGTAAPPLAFLPGCEGIEHIEVVLDQWTANLEAARMRCREGWLLFTNRDGFVRERLWPAVAMPLKDGPGTAPGVLPLHYLALPVLREVLQRQAMRLCLQAGLCASLEQENRWRLSQMERAQDHLDQLGQVLRRRVATLRQSDITNELETLMSSVAFPVARP